MALGNSIAIHKHRELFVKQYIKYYSSLRIVLVLLGVGWLFLLPLDKVNQSTYIDENALLPGQVHTYFGGSEELVLNAYRKEISSWQNARLAEHVILDNFSNGKRVSYQLEDMMKIAGLKPSRQSYKLQFAGRNYNGTNLHGVLRAPRGDATEAIVLAAPYRNSRGNSGIALLMTLARYFERWSIWSKDIVFLITEDNLAGPRAWLDAYHEVHDSSSVSSLLSKAGAIQEAVILEYASSARRFNSIIIHYDGNNGQLPNLDLVNAAVVCAHSDAGADIDFANGSGVGGTFRNRLQTVLRGMVTQGLGLPSYHGMFVNFKIDAVTIEVVPTEDGRLDDIQLGRFIHITALIDANRTIESITRSLNNLMERLHHAFFFYLLISTARFVSIATCLPSAMLIAASFTVTAIGMWMESIRWKSPPKTEKNATNSGELTTLFTEVQFALGAVVVLHFAGFVALAMCRAIIPWAILANFKVKATEVTPLTEQSLYCLGIVFALIEVVVIPSSIRYIRYHAPSFQETALLIKAFSHFATGMCLSTLSTLNFPLAVTNGVLAIPFLLVKPTQSKWERILMSAISRLLSPLSMILLMIAANQFVQVPTHIVEQATYGLSGIVYFCVFLPAYLAAQIVIYLH